MAENKTKLELNENELSNVSAGKSVIAIVEELFPLAPQYPEVIEIMDAYNNGDNRVLLMLLQKFKTAHPELANIFED